MKQPLPSGPTSLCFNKEDFMKENFNVEQFVVECRRRVPLENLRDDLGVYLKVLSSAMIELINKDYADFVNLSTNLVGMDKAINNLMSPLNQLKNEILNVRNAMDVAIQAIEEQMKQKSEIRQKKACLQRLIKIIQCLKKMESLLGINMDLNKSDDIPHNRELTGQLIERVATEFNKLQFFVNKSRGLPLVEEIRPRVMAITTTLQYSLEGSFKEGLATNKTDILCQCLRTYATIDKMRDAENLFRQCVVQRHMEEVINEQFIKNHKDGLAGMYAAILDFIPKHCKILKDITAGSRQGDGEVVRGYDFLVNSVWPEVISGIENRTPSIFAPGNPKIFHQKYLVSMDFLDKYERQCGSQASVRRLRSHPSHNTFMSKWSLPVYFQIRFQEIAGALETALVDPFSPAEDKTLFHNQASYVLWTCLHTCWQPDIYLQPLCHRFWKLNLQLLSRYTTWLQEVYDTEMKAPTLKSVPSSSTDLASKANGSETGVGQNGAVNDGKDEGPHNPPITMSKIVCLIADIQMFSAMLGDFYTENVLPRVNELGFSDHKLLQDSLQDSESAMSVMIPKYGEYIVREITSLSSGSLKTVNDIPRLYRRTNRETPSKPSHYVATCMKPIQTFLSEHGSMLSDDTRIQWVTEVLRSISNTYLSITSDVLTSVKKMEESLKRLKKAKSNQSLASSTSYSANLGGLSDDDKIRLQLFLDVTEFGNQIDALEIERETIEDFCKLYGIVEAAKASSVMLNI